MGCILSKVGRSIALVAAIFTFSAYGAGKIEIGDDRWISIGAGMRAAATSVQQGAPSGDERSTKFDIQSVRLYVNGQVHEKVKFTFNTMCKSCVFGDGNAVGANGDIDVLDAIVRFEMSPEFNIWAGRMLTPADRIEMNGPYYALSWNQYTVPLLPSDQLGPAGLLGRDDGVTAWGTVGKFQYAAGIFDGLDGVSNKADNVLFSSRVAFNFLNMEGNPAYYTSSTYYGGAGDVLTLALSYQTQKDGTGTTASPGDFEAIIIDALLEKVLDDGAVLTFEGEYKTFHADLTSTARGDKDCFCLFDGKSTFFTAAYLLPGQIGIARVQPYIRYTSNKPNLDSIGDSKLKEFGLNFIINGHNLRLNMNVTSGDANLSGAPGADVTGFSLGVQIQI